MSIQVRRRAWPRSFGGQSRSLMYTLVLFEELAAVGAPFGPLAGCQQTAEGIIQYGSEALRREVLSRRRKKGRKRLTV